MGIKIIHPTNRGLDALLQRALSLGIQQNRIIPVAPGVVPDKDLLPIRAPCYLTMIYRLVERIHDAGITPISFEGADRWQPAAVTHAFLQKRDPLTVR